MDSVVLMIARFYTSSYVFRLTWVMVGMVVSALSLFAAETNRQHWSFQPIQRVPVPAVPQGAEVHNEIDALVASRLAKAGLKPNPPADRATLLRRLSFDLVGLPPSPEEIAAFVADRSEAAVERVVDRLLQSPQYGERWARHWLDVVRYTESQGFEYDKLRDNAWHYRDYVIRSFNEDKPYDRFMKEQVAGDVLYPESRDALIAGSLLVCGPWDEAGNAQANATQRMITREEEVEDMISVVGQSFMGLTLNCARCHAHKFDPIPQEDYFRLKAVFDGVKHGERMIATQQETKQRDETIASLKSEIERAEKVVRDVESIGWKRRASERTTPSQPAPLSWRPLLHWSFSQATEAAQSGELEGGATISDGSLQLPKSGAYFRSAPIPQDLKEKTLEAWVSLSDLDQGGGAAISIEAPGGGTFDAIVYGERQARKWMAGSDGFSRTRDLDVPEEDAVPGSSVHMAVVYSADNKITMYRNGVPYGKPYTAASLPTYRSGEARVLLGMRHTGGGRAFLRGRVLHAAVHDRALSPEDVKASFEAAGLYISTGQILSALTPEELLTRSNAVRQIQDSRAGLSRVKPLPVSYVGTRRQPEPTRKLRRGDVKMPEEVVTPGALSGLPTIRGEFGLAADAPEAERRVKFAEWLADPANPLPARVMVNRLWHFHFGQGLVSTPNDFGRSGTPPSHPELLDWLASTFQNGGWRLKPIHRLIVLSATYQQSSALQSAALQVDADNALLWRYAPRRLEAETLRDAMLSVSGRLNLEMGGPSFRPFEVQKFPANAYVPVDKDSSEFNRRSVYRMNVNSGKEPLLDAFDCPDPAVKTPRRGVTTTPLQALAMMNNSFVQRQAEVLAQRAQADVSGDASRAIDRAYSYAVGRSPNAAERIRAREVVQARGLASVCWALLNSTEFLYVR
jgi:hypothetical protein